MADPKAQALPHRREWLLSALFVTGGSMAVLAGVSGAVKPPPRPLRVGANFWIGYEPLRFLPVGDRGPPARVVEMHSTSAVLEGLRAGTLDGAAITIDEAVRHAGPDMPLAVVLVLDRSEGADAVLARPGLPPAPAPGARIGVETEGVGALVVSRFLAASGVAEGDVRLVDMPASAHDAAFVATDVDYLATYEPHVTLLERAGAVRVFDSRRMAGEVVDVLVVRRDVLDTRRRDVETLADGWFDGLEAMRRDLRSDAGGIARRLDLSQDALATILRSLSFPGREENTRMMTDGTVDRTVTDLAAWARDRGVADAGRWLSVHDVAGRR